MSRTSDADGDAALARPIGGAERAGGAEIVGASPAILTMLERLRRVAASEAPVLIEGETGSGKELVARSIHYQGPRHMGPFVPVNCGALPDHLLEAELFGHERGAFTDAKAARRGLVAEARGGTLFFDEVDALSAKAQVTLLRFLQDQKYRPLGSERELQTNVRVVAATNQTLASVMRQGHFRSDLLYRLQILHLEVPALRDRQGDAVLLANHFARMLCARYQMPCKTFSADTLAWVRQHPWPGNVRELESWVHRELLMGDGPLIGNHPPPQQALPCGRQGHAISSFHDAKAEAVRQFERDYVIAAYLQAQGNVTRAAEIAGKERRAFGKLLKKHGVDRHQLPQALQPPSAGPVQPQGQ